MVAPHPYCTAPLGTEATDSAAVVPHPYHPFETAATTESAAATSHPVWSPYRPSGTCSCLELHVCSTHPRQGSRQTRLCVPIWAPGRQLLVVAAATAAAAGTAWPLGRMIGWCAASTSPLLACNLAAKSSKGQTAHTPHTQLASNPSSTNPKNAHVQQTSQVPFQVGKNLSRPQQQPAQRKLQGKGNTTAKQCAARRERRLRKFKTGTGTAALLGPACSFEVCTHAWAAIYPSQHTIPSTLHPSIFPPRKEGTVPPRPGPVGILYNTMQPLCPNPQTLPSTPTHNATTRQSQESRNSRSIHPSIQQAAP